MATRLTFTAGNHQYKLTDDNGTKLPVKSVTTLLKVLAKDALPRWAANTAADFATDHWDDLTALAPSARRNEIARSPWAARDKSAATGTQLHAWADQLLSGLPVDVPEEHLPTVRGLADWWEQSRFAKVRAESLVWSPEDDFDGCAYAGAFDLLATHPSYGTTLIDFKTGKGVYAEHAIQLAGYAAAWHHVIDGEDHPAPRVDTLAVVHVRPGGTVLHVLDGEQRTVAEHRWALVRGLASLPEPVFAQVIA